MKRGSVKKWLLASGVLLLGVGAVIAWFLLRPPAVPPGFTVGNGRIEATEIDIATKLAGRISEVLVHEGDTVDEAQVIARMDTISLEAQLRHSLAEAQHARDSRGTALAVVEQRRSEAALAVKDYERIKELFAQTVISEQKVDVERTRVETTRAALLQARSEVVEAQSAIDAAVAETERLRHDIDDSTLRAPVHGRVQYRLAEPGEVLPAGGKVITMLNLTDVYMELFLPEVEAGKVAIGAEGRIVLDAAPQWPIRANVSYVAAKAQFTPKTVETMVERQKLVFRIKLQLDPQRLRRYEPWVKVGLPGVAYVRLDAQIAWPNKLEPKLPPQLAATMP